MKKLTALAATLLTSLTVLATTSTGGLAPGVPMTKYGMPTPPAPTAARLIVGEFYLSEGLERALDTTSVYAELYPATRAEVPKAIAKALEGQAPADFAIGLLMPQALHLNVDGAESKFEELTVQHLRNGDAIEYDEKCGTHPKEGDQLHANYALAANAAIVAELVLTVNHYIPMDDRGEVVDPDNALQCGNEVMSRTFYSGNLTLKNGDKQVQQIPVLMQNVVEP